MLFSLSEILIKGAIGFFIALWIYYALAFAYAHYLQIRDKKHKD